MAAVDDGQSIHSTYSLYSPSSSTDTGVAGNGPSPTSSTGPLSPILPKSAPASSDGSASVAVSPRSPRPPFTPDSIRSAFSSEPRTPATANSAASSYLSPTSPLGTAMSILSSSRPNSATSASISSPPSTASSGKMTDTASVRSRKKATKKGKASVGSGVGSTLSSPISPASSTTSSSTGHRAKGDRTQSQDMIRYVSLYLAPALLAVPVGLLIHLTTLLLTPLYNSLPLSLHPHILYALLAVPPAAVYALITSRTPAQEVISARVCLTIMAIAGDLIVVTGRRTGSLTGALLGAEYGALAARVLLGVGAMGGAIAFALLCFDHAVPIRPDEASTGRLVNAANVLARAGAYALHVYYAEKGWVKLLGNGNSFLVQRPEKTILFLSLLLTALSLFVRAPKTSTTSFAASTHRFLTTSLSLTPKTSRRVKEATTFLPQSISPILLLLRLPLLILAVRQQIFLRPTPPYYAANGTTRVLHSEKSVTGQVVVAEHLTRGYRFLRCDASLLGGRWMRPAADGRNVDLGDSIFATFALQEIGVLAHRSDEGESLARTISMTTELQLEAEAEDLDEEKPQERALVIGLGVGISASAMSKRGMVLDAVEIDPAVYHAARDYFNATLPEASTTISLMPGQDYVAQVAQINEQTNGTMQKWSYVIHDCFSAGKLPVEVFAMEFWEELSGLVEVDGIVGVNVAGVLHSLATKRIVLTLLKAFTQCRAFGELGDEEQRDDLMNIVVLCTMAHSPLLTFRAPTRFDVLRSPLRSHVYRTFHEKEISLSDLVTDADLVTENLLITRNGSDDGLTQVAAGLATWTNMQDLLTREMWLAW